MSNGVKLEGLEDFLAELERLGEEGIKIQDKALRSGGDLIKKSIQEEIPVRSGNAKKNIKRSIVKGAGNSKYVEIGPNKKAFYLKFVEFGTSKQKANPSMARGYEKVKNQVADNMKEIIRKGLGL